MAMRSSHYCQRSVGRTWTLTIATRTLSSDTTSNKLRKTMMMPRAHRKILARWVSDQMTPQATKSWKVCRAIILKCLSKRLTKKLVSLISIASILQISHLICRPMVCLAIQIRRSPVSLDMTTSARVWSIGSNASHFSSTFVTRKSKNHVSDASDPQDRNY